MHEDPGTNSHSLSPNAPSSTLEQADNQLSTQPTPENDQPIAIRKPTSVRPGAAGLLTGMEYSRVGSTTRICPTSTLTTHTKVGLAKVQGNYPTHSE